MIAVHTVSFRENKLHTAIHKGGNSTSGNEQGHQSRNQVFCNVKAMLRSQPSISNGSPAVKSCNLRIPLILPPN